MLICQTNESKISWGNELAGVVIHDKLHQFCSFTFEVSFPLSEEMTPILIILKKGQQQIGINYVSFFVDPLATLEHPQHLGHIMANFYHREQDSL